MRQDKDRKIPLPIVLISIVVVAGCLCLGISFFWPIANNYLSSLEPADSRPTLPATYTPVDGSYSTWDQSTPRRIVATPNKVESGPVAPRLEGNIIFRRYNIRAPYVSSYTGGISGGGFRKSDSRIEYEKALMDTDYEYTFRGITESVSVADYAKEGEWSETQVNADSGSWLYLSVYNDGIVACEIISIQGSQGSQEIVIDAARGTGTFATCSGYAP